MSDQEAPVLAGVHHLKLPATDLARSREWYRSRLGYQVADGVHNPLTGRRSAVGSPMVRPRCRNARRCPPCPASSSSRFSIGYLVDIIYNATCGFTART